MDKVLEILQWAIPAGIGVWNIMLYRTYKRLNQAKAIKDTRDTWEQIAESNNVAILKQNEEIRAMRDTISRLEKMVFKVVGCRYYDVCPVRNELSVYKADLKSINRERLDDLHRKTNRRPRDGPGIEGEFDTDDGQPP